VTREDKGKESKGRRAPSLKNAPALTPIHHSSRENLNLRTKKSRSGQPASRRVERALLFIAFAARLFSEALIP